MKPVIAYKKENGFHSPSIQALHEAFDWLISMDEKDKYGFKGPDDVNRKFFTEIRDILCTQLDEDTYYNLHFHMLLYWIHEHWDRFERAGNQANAFFNYREIYSGLVEKSKPLPLLEDALPGLRAQIEERLGEKVR